MGAGDSNAFDNHGALYRVVARQGGLEHYDPMRDFEFYVYACDFADAYAVAQLRLQDLKRALNGWALVTLAEVDRADAIAFSDRAWAQIAARSAKHDAQPTDLRKETVC